MPLLTTGAGKYAVAAGGGVTITATWTANGPTTTTGGTSIDYGTLAIGAADANRVVAVFIASRNSSVPCYASTVTVGGVSLTAFGASAGTNQETSGQFWYGSVPSGTTANISATFAETIVRSMIQVYRIITSTVAPSAGNSVAGLFYYADPAIASITVPTGGIAIAASYWRNPTVFGITWTNATEDSDVVLDSISCCGAARVNGTGTVVVTATIPSPSTGDDVILSLAAWG